jgi:hypothetical protein
METWKHGDTEPWSHGDMETWTWRRGNIKWKRKPRLFSLIRLPFAHRANGSLPFVRLLMRKQTEVIRLQTE